MNANEAPISANQIRQVILRAARKEGEDLIWDQEFNLKSLMNSAVKSQLRS